MKQALALARSSETRVELSLNGGVGDLGYFGPAEFFTKQSVMDAVGNAGPFDVLDVVVNSPGGDVFEGLAIYNFLTDLQTRHDKVVNTRNGGLSASAGSVILMAGSSIEMPKTSVMMIHDPWTSIQGNAKALRQGADFLDQIKGIIAPAYMARGSAALTEEKLFQLMEDEAWLDAVGARALGLCTLITDAQVVVSSVALSSIYNDARMRPVFMSAIKGLSDAGGGKPLITLRAVPGVAAAAVEAPAAEATPVEVPPVDPVETPAVETPAAETPDVVDPAVEGQAADPAVAEPTEEDLAAQAALDAEAAHVAEAEAAATRLTEEATLAAQAAAHRSVMLLKPADVAEACAAAGCPEQTGPMMRSGLDLTGIQARLAVRTEIKNDLARLRNAFPSGPISSSDEAKILASVSVEDATKLMTDILAGSDPSREIQHQRSKPENTVRQPSSDVSENRKLHAAYSGSINAGDR